MAIPAVAVPISMCASFPSLPPADVRISSGFSAFCSRGALFGAFFLFIRGAVPTESDTFSSFISTKVSGVWVGVRNTSSNIGSFVALVSFQALPRKITQNLRFTILTTQCVAVLVGGTIRFLLAVKDFSSLPWMYALCAAAIGAVDSLSFLPNLAICADCAPKDFGALGFAVLSLVLDLGDQVSSRLASSLTEAFHLGSDKDRSWTHLGSFVVVCRLCALLPLCLLPGFADDRHLPENCDQDPLALSAKLLRLAVSLQGCSPNEVEPLISLSCKLKCVDLTPLEPQDLWCFWVNVYHSLLVQSLIVCGRPRNVRHLISFYNNCSYLVGGHIFSLAELEHLVLRSQMAKASARLMNLLVQVWRRDDKEFEERPALRAPYNPSSNFRCRPDWRLNLVLCAGNLASSSRLPVFDKMSAAAFDAMMSKTMEHFLGAAGRLEKKPMQLPYVLYRFRQDAPGPPTEGHERRWATALAPILGDVDRIAYRNPAG